MDSLRLSDEALNAHPTLLEVARRIATRVAEEPVVYTTPPRVLIYGGYVRDALLSARPKEADIQVFGVAPVVVEQLLHELFPKLVRRAGKQYEVLKIELDRGLVVDVSVPREETGGKSPHELGNPHLSPEEATRFRDFTINSLSVDPLTGEIIDPLGGARDISHRILRAVDHETFPRRPVHVFRACQLTSRFNLTPDPATLQLMRSMVGEGLTQLLPGNAIAEEVKKLMKAKSPSQGLELMRTTGALHAHFPMLHVEQHQWREWLRRVERTSLAMRNTRLNYGERSAVALATFFSLTIPSSGKDSYVDEMLSILSRLALTAQMTATIIQLLLHAPVMSQLLALPEKNAFRLRPQGRGQMLPRHTGRGREEDASQPARLEAAATFLRSLHPATWPAASCLAVGLGEGEMQDYEILFTKAEATQQIRMCHSIISGREVSEMTGIHSREELEKLLDLLRQNRFELITPARARRFVDQLMKHSSSDATPLMNLAANDG